jgi:hypothetical protein
MLNARQLTYFLGRIKIINDEDSCWLWTGGKDKDGYGKVGFNKKHYRAHRIMYLLENGPIEEGNFVCHTCDNPSCVRPSHLWQGTILENNRDKESKGRGNKIVGENHANSKLTDKEVVEIRDLYASGEYRQWQLAEKFGITQANVCRIVNFQSRLSTIAA